MEYRGVEYLVVRTITPTRWRWSVKRGHKDKAGRSATREGAISHAQRFIDGLLKASSQKSQIANFTDDARGVGRWPMQMISPGGDLTLFTFRRANVTVWRQDENHFGFEFTTRGRTVHGSVRTRLIGTAAHHARNRVNNEIRKIGRMRCRLGTDVVEPNCHAAFVGDQTDLSEHGADS
jgi:hypothetical protein